MRRRRHASTTMLVLVMLLVSAGIHLLLWPLGNYVIQLQWKQASVPRIQNNMEVTLVNPEQISEQESPGRLVHQDRAINQIIPKDTPNIAEFDQSVAHETRTPLHSRLGQANASSTSTQKDHSTHPQIGKPSPSQANVGKEGQTLEEQALPRSKDDAGTQAKKVGTEGTNQASAAEKLNIYGSPTQMRQVFGTQGSFDPIKEVDEGDESLLNSRRWKYASFFNRIRDAIAREWDPVTLHAAKDPTGQVYGTIPRTTVLFIRLNADGSVARVVVERSSGVTYLDEEAIRAVRAAQPFRNPPPQLVDPKTGFIDFDFGFILEINGRGRIFRFQR